MVIKTSNFSKIFSIYFVFHFKMTATETTKTAYFVYLEQELCDIVPLAFSLFS